MKEKFKKPLQREFNYEETLKVLKSPIQIYWTWGVERIIPVDETGLILKVNGHHHKDFVLITLGWNDTYTISLLDGEFNVLKSITDIYWDVLQFTVDREIEYIDSYNF